MSLLPGLFWRTLPGLLLLSAISLVPARAADPLRDPFYVRHQGPLVQIFGLPPAEGGQLTAAGTSDLRLVVDVANSFSGGSNARERLSLVGETTRTLLVLRRGLAERWEVGLDLPYVAHHAGHFNDLIDGFHDLTGLASDDRQHADDVLNYSYSRSGGEAIAVTEADSGWGDVVLTLAYQLLAESAERPRSLALRFGLKLPTGDSDALLGSGSTDLSLRLTGSDRASLAPWNVSLFGALGVLGLTSGEVLADQQRHWAGFGNAGLAWTPLEWLALKLQFDAHSPLYEDSDLRELSAWATQLTGGVSCRLPGRFFFDFGIAENVFTETSPDVGFHWGVRKEF